MSAGQGQKKLADQAAGNLSNLGGQYNQQQQNMYNLLFGGGNSASSGSNSSSGSGTSGVLNQFLNPSSLNVTSPTGVYAQQYTNAKNTLGSQYAQNASNIKSNAAQSGFGANTPAGFTQTEMNQNANALANATGQAFEQATTQQYQDALKNFWNSVGVAQNAMNEGESGALQGYGSAANTYQNLYGDAGKNSFLSQVGGFLGNLGQLGGGVGAAAKGLGSCWVAAELYGGWEAPEVHAIRAWLARTWYMRAFREFYRQYGERWARLIAHRPLARRLTRVLFDTFLRRARWHQ